jgi:hypothetical protein
LSLPATDNGAARINGSSVNTRKNASGSTVGDFIVLIFDFCLACLAMGVLTNGVNNYAFCILRYACLFECEYEALG